MSQMCIYLYDSLIYSLGIHLHSFLVRGAGSTLPKLLAAHPIDPSTSFSSVHLASIPNFTFPTHSHVSRSFAQNVPVNGNYHI